jgi:hypothetical protein
VLEADDYAEAKLRGRDEVDPRHSGEIDANERTDAMSVSRRSFDSGRSSAPPSTAGTDMEDLEGEDDDVAVDESARENGLHNSHRPLDVAIKEKTKRFLGLVKIRSSALSPSPVSRRKSVKRNDVKENKMLPGGGRGSREFDDQSRRTSVSSLPSSQEELAGRSETGLSPRKRSETSASLAEAVSVPAPGRRTSVSTNTNIGSPISGRQSSLVSSFGSPQQPVGRRFSVLKRTVSGKSNKGEDVRVVENGIESVEELDERVDHREGVYDSSKKQRVPSWVSLSWAWVL